MPNGVLALGTAALCASGSVWYLPAVADVRAGADRPRSQRLAALACLVAWGTVAAVGVLLLTPVPWTGTAVTAAGLTAAAGLRVCSRRQHAREQAEERRRWAHLGPVGRAVPAPAHAAAVFVAWVLSASFLALTAAATVLLAGGPD
ncbi:hypothetical protein GCM10010145_15420 [Streptomyces ruber]|uniref:Uncharacterized protein n=2 Tax=Streptomyces TaxID=1883 RepID=A0A918BB84_9ACTN|nr:hypothetical protein [Streptomyces ruber]GGQ47341.1 hypothetical protein GCM10010145_15420 [Streptomyces ruber]